jgi:hypothetical protein
VSIPVEPSPFYAKAAFEKVASKTIANKILMILKKCWATFRAAVAILPALAKRWENKMIHPSMHPTPSTAYLQWCGRGEHEAQLMPPT